jgi:hypothetical protein
MTTFAIVCWSGTGAMVVWMLWMVAWHRGWHAGFDRHREIVDDVRASAKRGA